MHKAIYINLPVSDLQRSRAFYEGLGYTIDERFSDDQCVGVVLGEGIVAMLLLRDFFATFTDKAIAGASQATEVINCLDFESRDELDQVFAKVEAAGGRIHRALKQEGPMYGASVEDPDGHIWELLYMPEPPA